MVKIILIVFLVLISSSSIADELSNPENTIQYALTIANDDTSLPVHDEQGIASMFGYPGDKLAGGTMACRPKEKVNSEDHICAHRSYPCGTILILENGKTNKKTWCVVLDRGPYGANVFVDDSKSPLKKENGKPFWYIKKNKNHIPDIDECKDSRCVGKWRGVLDMSPAVSKALGHTGMGFIKVWKLSTIIKNKKYKSKKYKNPSS